MANPTLRNGLSIGIDNYDTMGAYTGVLPGSSTTSAQEDIDRRARETTSITTHNLGTHPKYYVYMTCENYLRESATKLAVTNITDQIILPMPAQLMDANRVEYTKEELSPLGGAALNGLTSNMNNVRDAFGGARAGGAGLAGAAGAATAAMIGAGAAAGGSAGIAQGVALLPQVPRGVVQSWFGIAPNQFMVILLKGPTYKQFSMEWTISPKGPEQARNLNTTLKMLKNAQAVSTTLRGYFFTFPKIFRIYFKPADEFLYQFKPSVLTEFNVNYSASGMFAPTRIGAPDTVKISMNFMETEFFLSGDFK